MAGTRAGSTGGHLVSLIRWSGTTCLKLSQQVQLRQRNLSHQQPVGGHRVLRMQQLARWLGEPPSIPAPPNVGAGALQAGAGSEGQAGEPSTVA